MNSLVKSVHTENTHVVLESEAMVGYLVSDDPVLKSVGKQVFNYSICLQQMQQQKYLFYSSILCFTRASKNWGKDYQFKIEIQFWNIWQGLLPRLGFQQGLHLEWKFQQSHPVTGPGGATERHNIKRILPIFSLEFWERTTGSFTQPWKVHLDSTPRMTWKWWGRNTSLSRLASSWPG